jgi:hypothetical protein
MCRYVSRNPAGSEQGLRSHRRRGEEPADPVAATVRADVSTLLTASQLSPNIMVGGYVYNTAAGTLDTIVALTPVGQH